MTRHGYALIPSALGMVLRVSIAVFSWATVDVRPDERVDSALFLAGVTLFSLVPYGITAAVARRAAAAGAIAGTVALAADCFAVYAGLIRPAGSTAGLILMFMPVWNLFVFVPAALALAFTVQRIGSRGRRR